MKEQTRVLAMAILLSVCGGCGGGGTNPLPTTDLDAADVCNANSDCKDETKPICINGGTSSSACIACNTAEDCDVPNFFEACQNAGTVNSFCDYGACLAACNNDSNCNDLNPQTVDKCDKSANDTCLTACVHTQTN